MDTYVRKCFYLIVTLWISPGNLDLVKTRTGSVSICIFNTVPVIISWSSLLLLSLLSIRKFCFNKIIHQTSSNSWLLFWDCVMTLKLFFCHYVSLIQVWYILNEIPSEKSACMSLDLNFYHWWIWYIDQVIWFFFQHFHACRLQKILSLGF